MFSGLKTRAAFWPLFFYFSLSISHFSGLNLLGKYSAAIAAFIMGAGCKDYGSRSKFDI
jgi:hypothetical protein